MKFFLSAFFALCYHIAAFSQLPVRYDVALDRIHHHEITVTLHLPALPERPVEIRMPQSSPGRYALHQFAKNVYEEAAFDENGKPLAVQRKDPSTWLVSGHRGYVKFQYTLWANHGDGTYAGIDNRKLHLNMPAVFAYCPDVYDRPVELFFDLGQHPDWSVATQLKPAGNGVYWAPDTYYFYDSPTMVGNIDYRRWPVQQGDQYLTIEAALMHEGTPAEFDQYAEWMKKVVDTEKMIFGELASYDFGRYTFLLSYNPWIFGDGMEHRNSTVCSSKGNLAANAKQLIGTVAHEFFHSWNVERLRPKSLEPFDFDQPNMSGELWFAEGFTSYYDDLVLCRAGITTPEEYLEGLGGMLNFVVNAPGRNLRGPIAMSHQAPFVDAATSIDGNNNANNFVSYYPYGAVVGLSLDLSLRNRFDTLSLDHYMRYLWQHYGKTEVPYQVPDLQQALAAVTGDPAFAANFFQKCVYGHEFPDLPLLFAGLGIDMVKQFPGETDLDGLGLQYKDSVAVALGNVNRNHSLYAAGLNPGDQILSLNGRPIRSEADWNAAVKGLKPGQSVPIKYRQNGLEYDSQVTCKEDATWQLRMKQGGEKTDRMRKGWLWR